MYIRNDHASKAHVCRKKNGAMGKIETVLRKRKTDHRHPEMVSTERDERENHDSAI
jgi:hypothetical protein